MNDYITKIVDENNELYGVQYAGKTYTRSENESEVDFYKAVVQAIGEEEFIQAVKNIPNYNNNAKAFIPTITKEDYMNSLRGVKSTRFQRKPKEIRKKNKLTPKQIIAAGLASLALVAGVYGIGKLKKNSERPTSNVTQDLDEHQLTLDAAESMSYEELLPYLNNIMQRDTVETWNTVQDQFNNQDALSIKTEQDGDKQLYLKAEEVMALHSFLNSYNYSVDEFINIYSGSKLFQAGALKENYRENVMEVMFKYACRATQIPSDYMLSNTTEGQDLIKNFWNLVVSYNTASEEEKNAKGEQVLDFFKKLYDEDKYNIDSVTTLNPAEAEYVLSLGVPYMEATGILRDGMVIEGYHDQERDMSFKDLLMELDGTLYYTTTYDNKILAIEEAINNDDLVTQQKIIAEADGTFKVVENRTAAGIAMSQMPRALDERNIRALDRNIDIIFEDNSYEFNNYLSGESTPVMGGTSNTIETTDRNQAVSLVGEEAVKEAENKANEEVANANAKEEARTAGLNVGYNITYQASYNLAFTTGTAYGISSYDAQISSVIASNQGAYGQYASSFAEGVREGASQGIVLGQQQGAADKAKADAMNNNNQIPTTPVDPFVPDISNGEEYDPEYRPGSSTPSSSELQQPVTPPASSSSSSSSSTPSSSTSDGETTVIIPDLPPLPEDSIEYTNPFINANAEASQDAGYQEDIYRTR